MIKSLSLYSSYKVMPIVKPQSVKNNNKKDVEKDSKKSENTVSILV